VVVVGGAVVVACIAATAGVCATFGAPAEGTLVGMAIAAGEGGAEAAAAEGVSAAATEESAAMAADEAATESRSVDEILQNLSPGKTAPNLQVNSRQELQDVFDELTRGGSPVDSSYPGDLMQLDDGTTVGIREGSKSGGATIDVKLPGGGTVKVHLP
jgi:hypothetical protein